MLNYGAKSVNIFYYKINLCVMCVYERYLRYMHMSMMMYACIQRPK